MQRKRRNSYRRLMGRERDLYEGLNTGEKIILRWQNGVA
jgi:hypothetical protein